MAWLGFEPARVCPYPTGALSNGYGERRQPRPETLVPAPGDHDLCSRPQRRVGGGPVWRQMRVQGRVREAQRAVERPYAHAGRRLLRRSDRQVSLVAHGPRGCMAGTAGRHHARLEAEGYGTYQDFKRAWIKREHRAFPPLRMTTVYRI